MKTISELSATLEAVASRLKSEPLRSEQIRQAGTVRWLAAEIDREAARLAKLPSGITERTDAALRSYMAPHAPWRDRR